MADTFSKNKRSAIMRAVKSGDTKPEMLVRRLVHGLGYRYRLHRADLPGKPDLVFSSQRKVIFVHGCFWHGHHCPRGARIPKSNTDYWLRKITRNQDRDQANLATLRHQGWSALVVWECQTKDMATLEPCIVNFLEENSDSVTTPPITPST
ncbi:MAG: DNA mismatch endonuclease Vsr [Leptolyngbyaceae cyanobacterium MO_188.B28]|nr:DNA mismatch endonuclease Vsr [Leptolyngbyaceae cyanobacterium MO_188.B28]